MTTSIVMKLERELRSFFALAIMNIAFGGVAMALGISLGVQNVLAILEARNLLLPQLALTLLGFLAFGVSLRWLITSAEILDGVTDIKDDYERKKTNLVDENLTGLIVRMMAYYRENKSTIQKLTLVSKIAGVCFFINGIVLLINTVTNVMSGASFGYILLLALATVGNFLVSSSGIFIPRFFDRYSSTWEHRLDESSKVERELVEQLEGR